MIRKYARIGLLLVGCAAILVYQTRRLGLTVDETSHFAAAYSYWLGEDVLQPADTPPLTRAMSGWVPRLLRAPRPRATAGWKVRDAYLIGSEILDRPDFRARRLLFFFRLPFLVFPLLMVFLIWRWGRELSANRWRYAWPRAGPWSQRFSDTAPSSSPTWPRPSARCGSPTRHGDIGDLRLPAGCSPLTRHALSRRSPSSHCCRW